MPISSDKDLQTLLKTARTIAVVGASDKPWRDSHDIMRFLLLKGYRVFPVNPNLTTVLDQACYPSLAKIPDLIDLVDVFRRPEAVPGIVEDALAAHAKSLWLQLGVVHEEAAQKAEENGMTVVMDRCIAVEHRRLLR